MRWRVDQVEPWGLEHHSVEIDSREEKRSIYCCCWFPFLFVLHFSDFMTFIIIKHLEFEKIDNS